MQNEISNAGALLDANGHLLQKGYSKYMLLQYDREAIKANKSRIKEWDYYLITNDKFAIALTIDDNSYMGLVSATFLDFTKPRETTKSEIIPFTMGKLNFPSDSKTGNVRYRNKKVDFSFEIINNERHLKANYNNFKDSKPFIADIILSDEPKESMVIATPFKENPLAFYYNQKIIGMKARGTVQFEGNTYNLDENSFGLLDWGRGVWTYNNTWYWGAGQGFVGSDVFGFNIGYGFGDTTAATENMLFYNGTAHKLEHITFNIPQNQKGEDDFLKPWTFSASDGRFEMNFHPIIDRSALTSLGILCSDQHQVFGRYTGKARLDDGKVIEINNFLGFAEKVKNKW